MEKEYIVFCDESDKEGKYYCNFYGGVIVGASQYQRMTKKLNERKTSLNLFGKLKWEKVTQQYLKKYKNVVQCFFEEVSSGNVKVRIMFRQKAHKPRGLTKEDVEMQYFKLYYQFIKHAFGLQWVEPTKDGTSAVPKK